MEKEKNIKMGIQYLMENMKMVEEKKVIISVLFIEFIIEFILINKKLNKNI